MLVVLLFLTSCSTQKNTFPNRAYHTVTSAFNVNFNGKEALKKGEVELAKKSVDNYTANLPIYNYPAKSDLSSIYPQMDRTIEKASKSIYKHSMMIRGKEHVKTMDDVYMMMGKAYFYKQDYTQAQRIFSYITTTYKGDKWNCREEAMILGARTALRQNYHSRAQSLLDESQAALQKNNSKKLKVLFNAAYAEYHLTAPNGDMQSAIDYIQEAIANKPEKSFKTRLYFILGQLYETHENTQEARKYFQKVIKNSPEYEMEFNAHMHLAMNYDGTESSKSSILKGLNKMLAEKKNEEYKDQIYYAISKIAHIDEDEDEEIENLTLSVANYAGNDYQRTFSSLTLGDIYFESEEYIMAQNYYDTALLSLPKNYPNREKIIQKSTVLKELVDNLNVVILQDSLQRIAKMSPNDRNRWVNKMIADYTEAERLAAEEEANRMMAMQSVASMSSYQQNTNVSGKWYFYNQALVTQGKTEFFRLWGSRKLEDNWRISNKQVISFDELEIMNDPSLAQKDTTTQYDEDGNPIKGRETDPKKADFYTQDLPLTPELMDSSNNMIASSMYNAAIIYLDLLNDVKRSSETLEKLVKRFPEHELALPAIYMLYRNYTQINSAKAEEYKNLILTKYSDTDYALLIKDPDYYKRLAEQEKTLEFKYEETYHSYTQKQWAKTVKLSEEAIPICEDEELKSKYEYLRAVAVGQLKGEDTLIHYLKHVIAEYPKAGVTELAKTYLSLFVKAEDVAAVEGQTSTENADADKPKKESPFTYNPKEMHYIILIVDVTNLKINDVKSDIASFNRQFFSLQKFNINSFYIDQNEQMVTIAKFNNENTAMDYFNSISQNDLFTPLIKSKQITIYPISAANYTKFYNKKEDRPFYKEFFKENYEEKE